MTTKRDIIRPVLAVALFPGSLALAWILVSGAIPGAGSEHSLSDSSGNDVVPGAGATVGGCSDITAYELKERLDDESDEGFIMLDIRAEAAYDAGHIPGAINIPLNELGYRLFTLDRTKDIIVYCNLGLPRSTIACQVLVNSGFKDVYKLTGGMSAWNYAIETSDGSVSI